MILSHFDQWVRSLRPEKIEKTQREPIATFIDEERLPDKRLGKVGTVIINNRECPYSCTMCGLWQDTLNNTPSPGSVAGQIESALAQFDTIDAVKLYNAGTFFDEDAIPKYDRDRIADLCKEIDWVIVEARPDWLGDSCLEFADQINGRLEVAIGLETADEQILAMLNKKMSVKSFQNGADFLQKHSLSLRVFIMVKPPFCNESRAVELANDSVKLADDAGAISISLIPTYETPGLMEWLRSRHFYEPPRLQTLFDAAKSAKRITSANVFVDTWSVSASDQCPDCFPGYKAAFEQLNKTGELPDVDCHCHAPYHDEMQSEQIRTTDEFKPILTRELAMFTKRKPLNLLARLLVIALFGCFGSRLGMGGSPLFTVRTEVEGVDYRNICGDEAQLPVLEQNGQGIGILDFDGDGLMDMFVSNGSTESRWRAGKNPGCRLYRNLGGWKFEDVTDRAGVRGNSWSCGVAVADYDADGDHDIYVLNWGPNNFYENNGDGTFTDVTKRLGVAGNEWSSSAAFADFNNDGRLDIYVSNYVQFNFDDWPKTERDGKPCLYRGVETGCGPWCYEGVRDTLYLAAADGRFEDKSNWAYLNESNGFRGFGVIAADFDRDKDIDVYVGCDVMLNLYWHNLANGKMESVGVKKGGAYNEAGKYESGMGVAAVDIDRNGTIDLFTTNFAGEKNTFYHNEIGYLTDESAKIGFNRNHMEMGWGIAAQDFNQDGLTDVFIANGQIYPQVESLNDERDTYRQTPRIFLAELSDRNNFRLVEHPIKEAFGGLQRFSLRGTAATDFDNDGDLDLVAVQHNGPLVFFRNNCDRPALAIHLIDQHGGISPMAASITVDPLGRADYLPNQGYQSSQDPRLYFANPGKKQIKSITIDWPDGKKQTVTTDKKSGLLTIRRK